MRPLPEYVLVELDNSPYSNIDVTAKKYDTTQTGIVLDYAEHSHIKAGCRIYWKAMKDLDATFDKDGKKVAFININDVVGYDEA